MKTSELVRPDPHPFYGDSWERGLDPWHEDAFPDQFRSVGSKGARRGGWFLVDGFTNYIGFVPDGSETLDPAPHEIQVIVNSPSSSR